MTGQPMDVDTVQQRNLYCSVHSQLEIQTLNHAMLCHELRLHKKNASVFLQVGEMKIVMEMAQEIVREVEWRVPWGVMRIIWVAQ